MTDTNFEIQNLKLDEVLEELYHLREENQSLKIDNDFLQKQNAACKLRCGKFAIKVRELESEIADMKFTHKMLNSEEAGRAFARELLGKPMTREELAIEAAENAYEHYTGDDF
jgi:hypothetical protein